MKRMMLLCAAALAVAGCGRDAAVGRTAETEKPVFELVGAEGAVPVTIPVSATESTCLAAKELSQYIGKATGRTPEISTSCPAGAAVVIGTLDTLGRVPEGVREKLLAMKQDEAAWTGVADGKLWFVGRRETAELYAVYHFLESRVGVRWFQAPVKEDPGEYVPSTNRLAFAAFSLYREPFFAVRRLDGTGVAVMPIPEAGMKTAVRNGFQVHPLYGRRVDYSKTNSPIYRFHAPRVDRKYQSLGGGHLTFVSPMPGDKAFKDHPEWFALVDGKRVKGAVHMEQYCLSNPEVRRNVAGYIVRQYDAAGGQGQFLFGQVDSPHGGCECEKCRALDAPGENPPGGGRPSRTTRFVKTINDIAAQVWAKRPDADLRMWAYLDYRELPVGVKPDPRFKLYYCPHGRCYAHTLDDPKCERNVKMYSLLKEWQKLVKDVYIYDYLTCTPMMYTCNERQEAHDIALYARLGLIGWKNEAAFTGSKFVGGGDPAVRSQRFPSVWQWLYASSHLLWDPTLDLDALLDDAESKYYGVAYPAMRRYQKLRRRLWAETPGCMGYPTGDQRRPMALERAGAKEELLAFLDEAEKLAKDDPVVKFRVSRDRRWLEDFWIKANEEVKAKRGKVIKVPEISGKIKIDGDGSDAAWSSAAYTDQFKVAYLGKNRPDPDAKLATKVGVAYDGENLYFLLSAMEPSVGKMKAAKGPDAQVWDDDGFEIFLFPPSAENKCYHLAVNPAGALYGRTNPGGRDAAAFGAEAAAKVYDNRYVIELRVPVRKIAPLVKGDVWRLQVGRNRLVKDALMPEGGRFSLDGEVYTDTLAFRSMQIGSSYLRNGTFDELNDKGRPKSWSFPKGWTGLSRSASGVAVKMVPPQMAVQTMWHKELSQKPYPRKLRYTVRASGKGAVSVSFVRYNDTTDPKAKHGYRRKQLHPSGQGGTYRLSAETKAYTGEYEVAADEWCSIVVSCTEGNALIEDVSVDPM